MKLLSATLPTSLFSLKLEEGVDGLIHISDLSWSKKIKHPAEFTKIGVKINVVVLDVDVENRRLSLGHKQLEENRGMSSKASSLSDQFIKEPSSVRRERRYCSPSLRSRRFCSAASCSERSGTTAKVDETLDFKVIEFSKENKKIILSHSRMYQDTKAAEKAKDDKEKESAEMRTQRAVKKLKDGLEKTTLGDLDALANLKASMEKSEGESK
jgi:small subunit ribosomal protein S1